MDGDRERQHEGGRALRQKQHRAHGTPRKAAAQHRALEAGDRIGRRDRFRAERRAAHMGVAGLAAVAAGHRVEPRRLALVAHVVDQRPGAVERRRAEIIRVPRHHVAGRIADAAADAFDAGVGRLPFGRCRRHHGEILLAAPRRARNSPCAAFHLSKNCVISTARSLTTAKLRSGSSRSRPPSSTTSLTRVRQVQRGRPFTTMAQEPHMPTRQAKR